VKQYVQAGHVDEIHLAFAPGRGESLFSGLKVHRASLTGRAS
jgi:hypothetical protein